MTGLVWPAIFQHCSGPLFASCRWFSFSFGRVYWACVQRSPSRTSCCRWHDSEYCGISWYSGTGDWLFMQFQELLTLFLPLKSLLGLGTIKSIKNRSLEERWRRKNLEIPLCKTRWQFRIFLKLLSVCSSRTHHRRQLHRRGVRPSVGAAWYRHLSKSGALQNTEWSSIVSRAHCRRDATSLIPGFSKSVPNMKGDNWRMTLPPFPMTYSASATKLRKSNVTCLQLLGNDTACLHYGLLTTASEDAWQSEETNVDGVRDGIIW